MNAVHEASTPESKTTRRATRKTAHKSTRSHATHTAHTAVTEPGELPAQPITIHQPNQFGRINIINFKPTAEDDIYPARVELGEPFNVSAEVFIEGRTKVGATAVLKTSRGKTVMSVPMTCENAGLDLWTATLRAGEHSDLAPWEDGFAAIKRHLGNYSVIIEGWEDTYASWLHDARIKVNVNDDVENTLTYGAKMLERWAGTKDAGLHAAERKELRAAAKTMMDTTLTPAYRLAAADNEIIAGLHETNPLRDGLTASRPHPFRVERPKSSFAAWYQFFPRSEGAFVDENTGKIVQGTLKTSVSGLQRAADEGFNIVYVPPIFPIGETNRKGKDNALVAGPDDPGSPFAIGSSEGGHDTVDPRLGSYEDFKEFCAKAHELGLEVALDFALQVTPDHPWVKEHPTWFRTKADGTIAFAENPPKKYQDIYPIDFSADLEGIEKETVRLMNHWIEAGVTIFRVDNPHTKPVRFWQDVIEMVTKKHPETLFLAEAFTRPAMVRALSYAGFTQSHCYFPWRNTKEEIEEFLKETNGEGGFYQHNTFWPTTPDILTAYIRDNGVAGHAIRAVLAAMGSPSWGIYNGYELIENTQRDGFEEQANNEKYEIKVRDWSKADEYGIGILLNSLNRVRSEHPATHSYHNLMVLGTDDPNIIAFARRTPAALTNSGKDDLLIVVVNLDGHNEHSTLVHLPLEELGLPTDKPFTVKDELTGRQFEWSWDNYVSLAPWADVAHVLSVEL
ncbi:maltotransferase domain-containing protein [Bifidobacterium magnum]|nr:maltotransferase domain-containing protein [Bifidobacterium magnum]